MSEVPWLVPDIDKAEMIRVLERHGVVIRNNPNPFLTNGFKCEIPMEWKMKGIYIFDKYVKVEFWKFREAKRFTDPSELDAFLTTYPVMSS